MQILQELSNNVWSNCQPFYVIEGIDGSGKSTIGPLVAQSLGGVFYEYPQAFKPGLESIDKLACLRARFMFFLGYNIQAAEDIKTLSVKNRVICVRYIYSTLAYHIAKGLDKTWAWKIVEQIPLILPQKVFFLDVTDSNVQLSRLQQRGILPEDEAMRTKTEELRSIYLEMAKHVTSFEYIDTSRLTISDVVSKINLSIKEL